MVFSNSIHNSCNNITRQLHELGIGGFLPGDVILQNRVR